MAQLRCNKKQLHPRHPTKLLTKRLERGIWITENPALRLKKIKENRGHDRVLTEGEITRLLSAAKENRSPYLYCITLLSLTTGARQGELLKLEWQDIDFENKLAYMRESKNGPPRSISLCDPVIEELLQFQQNRNPQKPLIFASKTAFGRIDIKKAWQNALIRADIKNCRAHDMRHTFCTYATATRSTKPSTGHCNRIQNISNAYALHLYGRSSH